MKTFLIKYVVDTGYEYLKDDAIVIGENANIAVESLKNAIGKLGSDYWVHQILDVKEFTGNIFTRQYGFKTCF